MSKEQQELLDEAYGNYISYIHDIVQGKHQIYGNWYGKEEFIDKCKTNPEFSEKWGLKIEERELSLEDRCGIQINRNDYQSYYTKDELDENNIPTKLITITYNDKTIKSHE
jgi:hypothetical protein